MLVWVTNFTARSSDPAVSHVEISSKSCDHSQSDCLCGNCDIAHGNLLKVTRPYLPVCDTESDMHWGWLGVACETNISLCQSLTVFIELT